MKEGGGGVLVSDKNGMVDDERRRSLFYAEYAEMVQEIREFVFGILVPSALED